MQIKIALADCDIDYLERLTTVLEEYNDLHISVYSDKNALINALNVRKVDVLVIDPSMYSSELPIDRLSAVIMLTGEGSIPMECEMFPCIGKYQRISVIHQHILRICSEKLRVGSENNIERFASSIAVYSPVGGCGKTTVALITAARLALQGFKTFFLSLESYPSEGCFLPQNGQNGMSSMFERIGQETSQLKMFMNGCIISKSDNLYYMNHFDSPNDCNAMETDEFDIIYNIFRMHGNFDYIVIDMDSGFDSRLKHIFDIADSILLVERPDDICNLKYESFYEQAYLVDEHLYKMKRVLNFYNGQELDVKTEIPRAGYISLISGADSESLITKKASSRESDFVLNLVQ